MADLAGPQSLGEMGPSSKPKLGNNSFAWYMAIPKKIRWIISVIVVVGILFGASLGVVEVYKSRYVQEQWHSFMVWGKGLISSDDASTSVAKKDELEGMPPPGAAPDLNPNSNPKPAKVLPERRPPPGTEGSTRTAVAAAAGKASTAAPAVVKANVAASAASATVVAVAPTSVTADIATLKQEMADIKEWKVKVEKAAVLLDDKIEEVKKTTSTDKIDDLLARLKTQEGKTRRLEVETGRIGREERRLTDWVAKIDEERINGVRKEFGVAKVRDPEAILSASGPAETPGVPSANEPVVRSLRPATVSGGCVVQCGKRGK